MIGKVSSPPDISVVLPVYRTAEFLDPLYQRLSSVLKSQLLSYEFIFVDDASPDNAQEVLQRLVRQDPDVRIVSLNTNQGQHGAVMEGFRHAQGKIIAVMDADLQDEPEVIPKLLADLNERHPIVFAGRVGKYESAFRLWCSKLHKGLLFILTGLPRNAGMFFVCRSEVVKRLLGFRISRPFIPVLLARTGFPMLSLPVVRKKRTIGQSAYSHWKRFRMTFNALLCVLKTGPSFWVKIENEPKKETIKIQTEALRHHLHNREQIFYFDRKIKTTMIPEETPYNQKQVEALLQVLGLPKGAKILEVGCGMGRQTFLLAKRGYQVDGLDLVPYLLQKLHEYNKGRFAIRTFCCDVLDHPSEMDGQYDAVVGFFVLHHLDALHASFSAMARFLKPGGMMGFVEPNPYNLLYYFQILFSPRMTWKGDGGFIRMRKRILFHAMEQAGISPGPVIRFGFFPRFFVNCPRLTDLDTFLARVPFWNAFLPFQIFWGKLDTIPSKRT